MGRHELTPTLLYVGADRLVRVGRNGGDCTSKSRRSWNPPKKHQKAHRSPDPPSKRYMCALPGAQKKSHALRCDS